MIDVCTKKSGRKFLEKQPLGKPGRKNKAKRMWILKMLSVRGGRAVNRSS
jgi:hypothetical protein